MRFLFVEILFVAKNRIKLDGGLVSRKKKKEPQRFEILIFMFLF